MVCGTDEARRIADKRRGRRRGASETLRSRLDDGQVAAWSATKWSPDSHWIAYLSEYDGGVQLGVSCDGEEQTQLLITRRMY